MDATLAASLAASVDPKALSALQNRNGDPAVAKAVAGQFGSFLMQGLMQGSDGTAMAMTSGTGSGAVNAMFAGAMSRYAMSGDKLGLADMIYHSMAAKEKGAGGKGPASAAAAAPAAAATLPLPGLRANGLSLTPYRLNNGHRPIGPALGRPSAPAVTEPAPVAAASTPVAISSGPVPPGGAAAASAPEHSVAHGRWPGLSLPPQAHLQLAAFEMTSSPAAAGSTTPPAASVGNGLPTSSVITNSGSVAPYGLPWTHRGGWQENGAANPHSAAVATKGLTEAENFAEDLAPAIQQASAQLGVSPRILLAQAALETGWGHSVVGNNVFGVKAGSSWAGATVTARTHEMDGGQLVAQQGSFRSYASTSQAVDDYVALVSASARYRSALGAGDNVAAYAQALAAGGYATDPAYAAKLEAVADSSAMSDAVATLDEAAPGGLVSAHG